MHAEELVGYICDMFMRTPLCAETVLIQFVSRSSFPLRYDDELADTCENKITKNRKEQGSAPFVTEMELTAHPV